MEKMSRERKLLACLALMSVIVVSQAQLPLILGDGEKGGQGSALQSRNQANGSTQSLYQQNATEDNFTDVENLLNELEEEINASSVEGLLSIGKELRLRLREAFLNHRRRMEGIRLERRLFMEEKRQEMKELIAEFNRTRNEFRARIRETLEKLKELRQEFMSGTITKEEFKMELESMRLELRSQVELMIKLGRGIGELMREVALKNREFALEILRANREFREEMLQIMNQAREQWRKRGH